MFSKATPKIFALDAKQMKAAEDLQFLNGYSPLALMENAVQAVASCIQLKYPYPRYKRVVVWAGLGGNGADGAGVARVLQQAGYSVHLYTPPGKASESCSSQVSYAQFIGVTKLPEPATVLHLAQLSAEADLVIDALLGFGVHGLLRPEMAALIGALNRAFDGSARARAKIISIDLPSGLPASVPHAAEGLEAIRAHETLCLGHLKVSLVDDSYAQYFGKVTVIDIQLGKIDPLNTSAEVVDSEAAIRCLQESLAGMSDHIHKYSRGRCIIAAGSSQYPGARRLATAGALAAGAGYVNAIVPGSNLAHDLHTEFLPGSDCFPSVVPIGQDSLYPNGAGVFNLEGSTNKQPKSCLFGPGTTNFSQQTLDFMREWKGPVVLDAGALNPSVCAKIFPQPAAAAFSAPRIITPHRGEFDRIWTHIQQSEESAPNLTILEKTKSLSQKWNCTVVLKGASTIISFPTEKTLVLQGANKALARAGTGDVLAGFLAGLLARGVAEQIAVPAAVCIHNKAAASLQRHHQEGELNPCHLPTPCFPTLLAQVMTQVTNSLEV